MTHICVGNQTIIGSDNGLSPDRRQAIIWINAEILLIEPLGTNFNKILIEIYTLSFKKMHLKISSGKWKAISSRPQCVKVGNSPTLSCRLFIPFIHPSPSHYDYVTMRAMASQITSLTIVYSTDFSGTDERKHQSTASLAFVRGIHRWPVNSQTQMVSKAENVFIWWRHHANRSPVSICECFHWAMN